MGTMTAAVLHGVDDLRLDTIPALEDPAGPDDALLAVRSVGVCGSDVHYWRSGRIGTHVVTSPMILGHECSGEVVAVGANVTHVRPGDRVAVEPGVPCRVCAYCTAGRYNLCTEMRFFATPPVDGALTATVSHPAALCYPLPESVGYEEGALVEPLSVGLYAVRRGGVGPGASVLVLGAGPIGLVTLLAARAAGATELHVADLRPERLEAAARLGATPHRADDPDYPARLREATDGLGPEVVIECSGAPAATRSSVELARPGGTVVLVGNGPDRIEFPTLAVGHKELDVLGVFRYHHTWPAAIGLLASGQVDVTPLITHRYGLPDVLAAFERAHTGEDGAIKVMVNPGE